MAGGDPTKHDGILWGTTWDRALLYGEYFRRLDKDRLDLELARMRGLARMLGAKPVEEGQLSEEEEKANFGSYAGWMKEQERGYRRIG